MTKTVVVLLSTLAFVGTASAAVELYRLDDDEFLTQFSGTRDNVERKGGDGDFKALYGLQLAEDSDYPCYLKARSRHINAYGTASYTFDNDSCDYSNGSLETVEFTGTDTYIRGVQVCTNNSGTRLKGVRIYGATLNRASGTLTNVSTPREFDRPNCNGNWKVAQYCPAGEIATQVRVSYDDRYSLREINGLALVCRAVEPT